MPSGAPPQTWTKQPVGFRAVAVRQEFALLADLALMLEHGAHNGQSLAAKRRLHLAGRHHINGDFGDFGASGDTFVEVVVLVLTVLVLVLLLLAALHGPSGPDGAILVLHTRAPQRITGWPERALGGRLQELLVGKGKSIGTNTEELYGIEFAKSKPKDWRV